MTEKLACLIEMGDVIFHCYYISGSPWNMPAGKLERDAKDDDLIIEKIYCNCLDDCDNESKH
jgi:hypothetical protein